MRTAFRFGDMSSQDALNAAAIGEARAKASTDFVDSPQPNGFPGFSAIWDRLWGVGEGILTNRDSVASTIPVSATLEKKDAIAPVIVLAGGALLAIYLMTPVKRKRK